VSGAGPLPEADLASLFGMSQGLQGSLVFGGTVSISDDQAGQVGALVSGTQRAAAADSSAAFTGAFGVLSETQSLLGVTTSVTNVVDASSGDATIYIQGHGTATSSYPSRAQLAALASPDLDTLVTNVNALYASFDTTAGLDPSTTPADVLFTINGEQVLLNPVAPPSVRFETYAALAADDDLTFISAGVKDSMGRTGIEIYSPLGATSADESKISYIFDPVSLLPLEDTVYNSTGGVVERQTILGMTTAASLPPDPYSS
jgi:hypothetical protein